ncbi:MAG: RNA pseudouridine synthase [Clostridia bacterium]|nr:RNA pseudouridine synthase [Clostridia bacterium]
MTKNDIPILYDDKELLVVDKPIGLLSAPSQEDSLSVATLLDKEREGAFPITPVNRLDRNVGGVMVLVKTSFAAAYYSQAVSQHQTYIKEYLAVVEGSLAEKEGTLRDFLFKDSSKNKTFVVKKIRKGVKEAVLDYRVLQEAEEKGSVYSLVLVRLHTGRTHQIRVQFASRGHSLYGDGKYGGRGNDTLALYSFRVTFKDRKGNERRFEAHPPSRFPWTLFFVLGEKF